MKMLKYAELDKITPFYQGVFSNWYSSEFQIGGIKFNCAEQYMMFMKAMFFEDKEAAQKIMTAETPREQKALGRTVKNFSVFRWNAVARHVVYTGLQIKFKLPEFSKKLEKTKGTLLVEASPTDVIWGVGLSMENKDIYDRSKWRGTNWLGEVLTDVRIGMFGE